ncbi:hypothetical protein VFPPC_17872 [Pochonia chlamydosporia 170]|uniref:Uncharacterized protein n=1 Tax=Pochonia chlamydosporia 170 TaxID=1380566 RepID=A0A219ARW1_METCM|nr:hypothetical protein VFPPC_17872 [Pochonia chlamydosporia 170]OWT42935.1 hypothetical protein VFPPC_17872 [Pochonia chlamydosporia 170]
MSSERVTHLTNTDEYAGTLRIRPDQTQASPRLLAPRPCPCPRTPYKTRNCNQGRKKRTLKRANSSCQKCIERPFEHASAVTQGTCQISDCAAVCIPRDAFCMTSEVLRWAKASVLVGQSCTFKELVQLSALRIE